jgi:xylulokinase
MTFAPRYSAVLPLFPRLEFKAARVIGGGSPSNLWNQIKADVLGIPYVRLNRQEFAVLGSAVVAGHAVGVFRDLKATARSFVQTTDRIEPRPAYHALYQPFVSLYASLFDTLRGTYHALATAPVLPQQ